MLDRVLRQAHTTITTMAKRWPYDDKSTGSEEWGKLALALAFSRKGWCAYPEVGFKQGGRVDLLAIDTTATHAIAVECKTFVESETVNRKKRLPEILGDAHRLLGFTCRPLGTGKRPKVLKRVVYVINWSEAMMQCWPSCWVHEDALAKYEALPSREVNTPIARHLSILVAVAP